MVKRANSCSRLIKRLERLESKRPQRDRSNAGGREALVLCGRFEGESHFAVTFQKGSYWRIEQVPGPGPELDEYGAFDQMVIFNPFEAKF